LPTHGYSSISDNPEGRVMKTLAVKTLAVKTFAIKTFAFAALLTIATAGAPAPVSAQSFAPAGGPAPPPFTATLSNDTPLVFGMGVEQAARALDTPLNYVSGRPGDEIYLAFQNIGGSGLFFHKDRLYLLFRKGRLAGWKGDWGHNWMWQ
jgi:hypothetical protein